MDLENYISLKPSKSVNDLMKEAIAHLAELDNEDTISSKADMRVLAQGIKMVLVALQSSLGECRGDIPYSPLRPIRQLDGTLIWCCNHKPEHCSS